jgi:hypothetical protein
MTLAIVFYDVVLFVHIVAVVVAFGVTFTYPLIYAVAGHSDWPQRAGLHSVQQRVSRNYVSFGLLVVVLAGAYLASDRSLWGEPWVAGPMVIAILIGGIGGGYLGPREHRLAEIAGAGTDQAAYGKVLREVRLASTVVSLLVLLAIFLMTTKPG